MSSFEIEGMTIAITNMKEMVEFYTHVFGVEFNSREMRGHTLFSGAWGGIRMLLCPKELASNEATQNRHQFDLLVINIEEIIEKTLEHHGSILNDLAVLETQKIAAIYDPDGNSMVLKENF